MSTLPDADSLFHLQEAGNGGGPDLRLESMLHERGRRIVAGVDEAGRGPLAGPVVAAAVVLDRKRIPDGLNDSKKLEPAKRLELFALLAEHAEIAWCSIDARMIDRINIRQATLLAMYRAVSSLTGAPDKILIDGRDVPPLLQDRGQAVVSGDSTSLSIAAASIVAKVVRDKIMQRAHTKFPDYGFARHKGYSTAAHMRALAELGPCSLHRQSFAPVSSIRNGGRT